MLGGDWEPTFTPKPLENALVYPQSGAPEQRERKLHENRHNRTHLLDTVQVLN